MYEKIKDPLQLFNRTYMCLYEPLCWKQLEWEEMPVPAAALKCSTVSLKQRSNISFFDWSLHDGTMASLSTQIENIGSNLSGIPLNVYSCNYKWSQGAKRNYHYNFKLCEMPPPAFIRTWKTRASDEVSSQYFEWFKTNKPALNAAAHITSFIPPMFDFLMSFNRTIIVNALHRINMFRCSYEESKATFDNLKRLASSGQSGKFKDGPTHIIAPGYIYEIEYIRHYTGIRSLYLPFSLFGVLHYAIGDSVYTGEKEQYLWDAHIGVPDSLANHYTFVVPKKYELSDNFLLVSQKTMQKPFKKFLADLEWSADRTLGNTEADVQKCDIIFRL
jgi:hypothetical protein